MAKSCSAEQWLKGQTGIIFVSDDTEFVLFFGVHTDESSERKKQSG